MSVLRPQAAPIDSPCIGVCTLGQDGLCQGCARTVDEITRWLEMSDRERRGVLRLIAERRRRPIRRSERR